VGSFFSDELDGVRVEGGAAFDDEAGEEFAWADREASGFGFECVESGLLEPEVDRASGTFEARHQDKIVHDKKKQAKRRAFLIERYQC
jgi:hypothetical protein